MKENADFVSSVAVQAGYRAYIIVERIIENLIIKMCIECLCTKQVI